MDLDLNSLSPIRTVIRTPARTRIPTWSRISIVHCTASIKLEGGEPGRSGAFVVSHGQLGDSVNRVCTISDDAPQIVHLTRPAGR